LLKITSMCSIHFGVLESVECKPVTFSCSGCTDQGNEPSWEACSGSELQFPLGYFKLYAHKGSSVKLVTSWALVMLKHDINAELQSINRGQRIIRPAANMPTFSTAADLVLDFLVLERDFFFLAALRHWNAFLRRTPGALCLDRALQLQVWHSSWRSTARTSLLQTKELLTAQ